MYGMPRVRVNTPEAGVINLRPSSGNRSRGVDDAATRDAITALVNRLVRR
jgi:hypothetical protein